MVEAEEQHINLRLISSDEYAILHHPNQFAMPRNSLDPRFHTVFQQDVFNQLYDHHRQFASHKYVDWAHLNSLDCFSGAYNLFFVVGLRDIVALRCNYNEDMIKQFYAIVYVSQDFESMTWMTGNEKVEATKPECELALKTHSGRFEKVYSWAALRTPTWCQFYDENIRYTPRKIVGLLHFPSLINRIINRTFFPKSGNFDAVRGHAWNITDSILSGRKFDSIDLIIMSGRI